MRYQFDNIVDFFNLLNAADINYLVLRNYENLLTPEMYLDGHGDIDLLCEDAFAIVNLIDAQSANSRIKAPGGDGIHYIFFINGQRVSLDLRQVGDGYYCKKWEQDLLDHKVKYECFYVMGDKDYFYTLVYHAILQKRSLSDDYLKRLVEMSNKLSISLDELSQQGLIRLLEKHMRDQGYRFTYSHDRLVPNRFNLVDKSLVDFDFRLWSCHFWFDLNVAVLEWLVKIKHLIK